MLRIKNKAQQLVVEGVKYRVVGTKLSAGNSKHLQAFAVSVVSEHKRLFDKGFSAFTVARAIKVIQRDAFHDCCIRFKVEAENVK